MFAVYPDPQSVFPAELTSGHEIVEETDPETLLEGEDPRSGHVDDAVHWVRVYGELLTVKMSLIDRAEQPPEGVADDALKEAALDQRHLRAEAERLRRRLEYWTNRTKVLAAQADPGGS